MIGESSIYNGKKKSFFYSIVQRFRSLSSSRKKLLINALVVVFLSICVRLLVVELTTRNYNRVHLQTNRQCTENAGESRAEQCVLPDKIQFQKFVWLIVDAFPRWEADELFEFYNDHSVKMNVFVPGLKLSHSIFISFFTGEPPIYHWVNREIDTDCLIDSMSDAGMGISFVGYPQVVYEVIGRKRTSRFHKSVFSYENANRIKQDPDGNNVLHQLMSDKEGHMEFAAQNGDSVLAYSTVYDTAMHLYGHEDPAVKRLLSDATDNLKWFKQWIDDHPEYLLIINADHGVDGPGGLLHGGEMPRNHGWLIFYNPRFGENTPKEEIPIDVVDVCPTVAKYLKNVDIPSGSVGMARNHYCGYQNETKHKVLYQNLKQIYHLGSVQKAHVSAATRELVSIDPSALTESLVPQLERAINELKDQLFAVSALSMPTFLSNILASCIIIAYLIMNYNEHIIDVVFRRNPAFKRAKNCSASSDGRGLRLSDWMRGVFDGIVPHRSLSSSSASSSSSVHTNRVVNPVLKSVVLFFKLLDRMMGILPSRLLRLAEVPLVYRIYYFFSQFFVLIVVYLFPFYVCWTLILWHVNHELEYSLKVISTIASPLLIGLLFWTMRKYLSFRRFLALLQLRHIDVSVDVNDDDGTSTNANTTATTAASVSTTTITTTTTTTSSTTTTTPSTSTAETVPTDSSSHSQHGGANHQSHSNDLISNSSSNAKANSSSSSSSSNISSWRGGLFVAGWFGPASTILFQTMVIDSVQFILRQLYPSSIYDVLFWNHIPASFPLILAFLLLWRYQYPFENSSFAGDDSSTRSHRKKYFWFYISILFSFWAFQKTEDWMKCYFIFECHIVAFYIYVSLISVMIYNLLRSRGSMEDTLIPGLLLQLFLQQRDMSMRLYTVLGTVWLYVLGKRLHQVLVESEWDERGVHAPLYRADDDDNDEEEEEEEEDILMMGGGVQAEGLRSGVATPVDGSPRDQHLDDHLHSSHLDRDSDEVDSDSGVYGKKKKSSLMSVSRSSSPPKPLLQMSICRGLFAQIGFQLLLVQITFLFCVILDQGFDLNLDPITGQLGRKTYDHYVWVSAFLMAYYKYSPFFLFVIYLWFLFRGSKWYYLLLGNVVLLFSVVNVIFHEVLWRYMMADSFTELLVSDILFGGLGITIASVDALRYEIVPWCASSGVEHATLMLRKTVGGGGKVGIGGARRGNGYV